MPRSRSARSCRRPPSLGRCSLAGLASPAADPARRAAESAARSSYGRLLALLSVRTRDIAAAEDALADAFAAALQTWPVRGVPDRPEAWLLTTARNAAANRQRHERVRGAAVPEITRMLETVAEEREPFPDSRLALLFACTHPAIDPAVRAPLMLQTVLGLDAVRIGAAFLVSPATMGQRLVRAKTKLKTAGARFTLPDAEELPHRLPEVLSAIYAAYGAGWDDISGEAKVRDLVDEAAFLARLVVALLPDNPEAKGLLALILYCEARRPARRDRAGRFVPLAEQDHSLWLGPMIVEAEQLLTAASAAQQFGRFQCEAAIQSVHAQRAITGRTNHQALLVLYGLLEERAPSLGASIGRAAVLLEAGQREAALAALDRLPQDRVASYQPYWVTRARVLEALGDPAAGPALTRAIGLTTEPAVRDYLRQQPGPADP